MSRSDSLRRLADLVRFPKEELEVELKNWLDLNTPEGKADLAQAILALANHGGGWVLLGFTDSGQPDPNVPSDFSPYNQDLVNGIVKKFADPVFHCDVEIVTEAGRRHPVISVPGSHRVPIRAKCSGPNEKHVKQNTYYTRRPGPESAPISTAREWDELIGRCVLAARTELFERLHSLLTDGVPQAAPPSITELLERWRADCMARFEHLVQTELPNEQPSRYANGIWSFSYILEPPSDLSLEQLEDALRRSRGRETGWPAWVVPDTPELQAYPFESHLECWLHRAGRDSAHSDFWRASPKGQLFLLRGYQEDAPDSEKPAIEPGTAIERRLHR